MDTSSDWVKLSAEKNDLIYVLRADLFGNTPGTHITEAFDEVAIDKVVRVLIRCSSIYSIKQVNGLYDRSMDSINCNPFL